MTENNPMTPEEAATRRVETQKAEKAVTRRKAERKVRSRDLPRLLEALARNDNDEEQQEILRQLCPCRNPRYDREVWLAIFHAYENARGIKVRDQALHAIGTLRERARTDPRSQELVRWLAQQGIRSLSLIDSVPVWQPNLRGNGLYIPRFEAAPRSRANRRR